MKRINAKEMDLAHVARDLFLKGSPEYRIAKYAYDKHFTKQQLINFLNKIPFMSSATNMKIVTHFWKLSHGKCDDAAISKGNEFALWLKENCNA